MVVFAAVALLTAACSSDPSDTTSAASGNDVSSAVVMELQTTLAAVGYDPGPVDGTFGPSTITALEEFQADAGITVDGKYGPETHRALEEAAAESGYDWDKHAAIEEMQQEMADLGYYGGSIDGEYGAATQTAVKAAQADGSLTPDGIYGPDTHSCLIDLGGDA